MTFEDGVLRNLLRKSSFHLFIDPEINIGETDWILIILTAPLNDAEIEQLWLLLDAVKESKSGIIISEASLNSSVMEPQVSVELLNRLKSVKHILIADHNSSVFNFAKSEINVLKMNSESNGIFEAVTSLISRLDLNLEVLLFKAPVDRDLLKLIDFCAEMSLRAYALPGPLYDKNYSGNVLALSEGASLVTSFNELF